MMISREGSQASKRAYRERVGHETECMPLLFEIRLGLQYDESQGNLGDWMASMLALTLCLLFSVASSTMVSITSSTSMAG